MATPYDLINPKTGEVVGQEDAREIFDMIVHGAWLTGEPGTFFIDRANEYNPVPALGSYEATNPCGEQPLLAYDVCNLGSVNLGLFVKADARPGANPDEAIDWEGLRQVIHLSTHFLDNVIDANQYPLPEIHDLAQSDPPHRAGRHGVGGHAGPSRHPLRLGRGRRARPPGHGASSTKRPAVASERLAETRGVFPEWERVHLGSRQTAAARRPTGAAIRPERALRNCNLTTVAPTGTISIFAGCSGGHRAAVRRRVHAQPGGLAHARREPGLRADREGARVGTPRSSWSASPTEGHIHFDEVPEEVQRTFRTAHDITPEWHVRMQAAFQEHCDSAISKTTNFPREATEEQVREIYELAFGLGCKGVTVYRDGSRDGQVLSTGKTAQADVPRRGRREHLAELEQQLADAREEAHNLRHESWSRLRSELRERDLTPGPRATSGSGRRRSAGTP